MGLTCLSNWILGMTEMVGLAVNAAQLDIWKHI